MLYKRFIIQHTKLLHPCGRISNRSSRVQILSQDIQESSDKLKLLYLLTIQMPYMLTKIDNDQNKNVALECKEFVRYLGVIIDNNLSWKHHIDHVAIKISQTVGLICKLRHFLPRQILLTIYRSLVTPYLTYGLVACGQAYKSHLEKLLKLQK